MAKKKQKIAQVEGTAPSPPSAAEKKEPSASNIPVLEASLSFREYLLLNLIFDAFCIVQLVLARLFIRETRGLYFFFAMLIIGFFLVSMFDYLYERSLARKVAQTAAER